MALTTRAENTEFNLVEVSDIALDTAAVTIDANFPFEGSASIHKRGNVVMLSVTGKITSAITAVTGKHFCEIPNGFRPLASTYGVPFHRGVFSYYPSSGQITVDISNNLSANAAFNISWTTLARE